MAYNWLMMTSSGDDKLAEWDIICGGLDKVTEKTKKKINRRQSKKPPSLQLRGLKKNNKPKAKHDRACLRLHGKKKNKWFNKSKNRALLTLRRSQKHYEIFSTNVFQKNITRKQLRLETIEIA